SAGPSISSPIFRGRIAHLASTLVGMNKVIASDPPLPSTWLYVLDPQVRYLDPAPVKRRDPTSDEFDPFQHLGLDRDEAPPPVDPDDHFERRKVPSGAWTAFEPTARDVKSATVKDLGSIFG